MCTYNVTHRWKCTENIIYICYLAGFMGVQPFHHEGLHPQKGISAWGLMLCGCHSEILNNFIFKFVVCEQSDRIMKYALGVWCLGSQSVPPPVLFSIYKDEVLTTHFQVPTQVWVYMQDQRRSRGACRQHTYVGLHLPSQCSHAQGSTTLNSKLNHTMTERLLNK